MGSNIYRKYVLVTIDPTIPFLNPTISSFFDSINAERSKASVKYLYSEIGINKIRYYH